MRYFIFLGLLAYGYFSYLSHMDHKALGLVDNLRSQYMQVIDHPETALNR